MAIIEIQKTTNLDLTVTADPLHGYIFTNESEGHKFVITGTRSGSPVTLAGVVTARFKRNNKTTVFIAGDKAKIENGKAVVTLLKDCYNVPGRFDFYVYVTSGGATTCVYYGTGTVNQTEEGTLIDSGEAVPSLEELTEVVQNAQAATSEAENVNVTQTKSGNAITLTTTDRNGTTVSNILTDPSGIIAYDFDATLAYSAGTYVIYTDGNLYRLTSDHEANVAWSDTSKTKVTIGAELTDLKSALGGNIASLPESYAPNLNVVTNVTCADGGSTIQYTIPANTANVGVYSRNAMFLNGKKYLIAFDISADTDSEITLMTRYGDIVFSSSTHFVGSYTASEGDKSNTYYTRNAKAPACTITITNLKLIEITSVEPTVVPVLYKAFTTAEMTDKEVTTLKTARVFGERTSSVYAPALLAIKFSTLGSHKKLYLKAIYRNYGTSHRYAVELRDENDTQILPLLVNSDSFVESTDPIRFETSGVKGYLRIDWSIIPSGALQIFTGLTGLGIMLSKYCNPEYNITDKNLALENLPADAKSVNDAIDNAIDTASNEAYPLTKYKSPKAIFDIKFTTYDSTKTYTLNRIGRNASIGSGRYAYYIGIHDGTSEILLLNMLSSSYTETVMNNFNVGGLTGTLWIDWNALTDGAETEFGLTPFSQLCYIRSDLESKVDELVNASVPDAYPLVKYVDQPIFDIWFDNYDNTKKYRLAGVGRKIAIGSNVTTYVDVYDDAGTRYLILNVLSANYTEKIENSFSVNGLTGKFWIDWSAIEEGTQKTWNRAFGAWFSPLCFAVSNLRSDVENLKSGTEDVTCVIPDKIYGVVGHPFSIYYYQIFQYDSLDDRHFQIVGASAHVKNLGDRIRFACDEEATYNITIRMRKNNRNNLWTKTFTVQILAETIPSIKAMFIGDSFTDQGRMQAELKRMMGNALTTYGTRAFSVADSAGTTQSGNDEGRSSWSWANYTTQASKGSVENAFWDGSTFNFSYYMTQHPEFADVTDVFLLSGPNDYDANQETYIGQMNVIVNSIKAYSQNIRIHCMMPLTCNCLGYAWGMLNNNGGEEFRYRMLDYGQVIMDTYGNDSQCYVVPTHVNFDRIYDFPRHEVAVSDRNPTMIEVYNDNVHPNQYGYFSMADMIFGDIVAHCQ